MPKRAKKPLVFTSDEEFIRLWQESRHVNEIAEALNVTRQAAGMRAKKMRDNGVPLKRHARAEPRPNGRRIPEPKGSGVMGRRRRDYSALAELARKYAPKE
jgi:DNA-binding Lrp family transcriptional regulator